MTRSTLLVAALLFALIVAPAMAADPAVTKSVLGEADGASVVLLRVTAKDRAVYGVTITDASASVEDIIAPEGWIGISSGDRVLFRTTDTPIKTGRTVSFRIVTTNGQADLGVTFRGEKTAFGSKKTI